MEKYLTLLSKFPHWNEVLSVLTYGGEAYFVSKSRKNLSEYIDPYGEVHQIYSPSEVSYDSPMIVNGSIHLETHPLSKGVIPYSKFKRKLAIEHTTGCSPWDFLQMVDLAQISKEGDPKFSQGCNLTFLMYKKFYDRYMKSNFSDTSDPEKFENYKSKIDELLKSGHISIVELEPTQYWLENIPDHRKGGSDAICFLMNWCNFRTSDDVMKIARIASEVHRVSKKDIYIKLHSYCKESYLKYLNEPYIKIIKYTDCSKYDVIDQFDTFFVDGTGIGYEALYRSKKFGRDVQFFSITGFDSEYNQFEGVKCMNVLPELDQDAFIRGARISSYPDDILDSFFPHKNKSTIAFDCYNQIIKLV